VRPGSEALSGVLGLVLISPTRMGVHMHLEVKVAGPEGARAWPAASCRPTAACPLPACVCSVSRDALHTDIRLSFMHRYRQLSGVPVMEQGVMVLQVRRHSACGCTCCAQHVARCPAVPPHALSLPPTMLVCVPLTRRAARPSTCTTTTTSRCSGEHMRSHTPAASLPHQPKAPMCCQAACLSGPSPHVSLLDDPSTRLAPTIL
jgi:hypothetical protein